jgi:nucleoid-associated protein YgaU
MVVIRRQFGLLALLAFEGVSVGVLHRLGSIEWLQIPWSDVGTWLEFAPVEDVLAAGLRQLALLIAYWLLGTTALYLTARVAQIPMALRSVEWATVPAVRRMVDAAVAVSIATASITVPSPPVLADAPPPVVVEADEHGRPIPPGTPDDRQASDAGTSQAEEPTVRPVGPGRIGWTPIPAGSDVDTVRPLGGAVESLRDRLRVQQASNTAPGATSVVVEPGDHLWAISRRHLEAVHREAVDNDAVAAHWRRVIDENRHRLQSGDPDLIYPGEMVMLPPIDTEDQ